MSSARAQRVSTKPSVQYHSNATQTDTQPVTPHSTLPAQYHRLSFAERKVALNLAQFAQSHADGALDADKITNLIETLTAEAPESVEKLVTDSEKEANGRAKASGSKMIDGPLSDEEKKDLEALIALAQRRLQSKS